MKRGTVLLTCWLGTALAVPSWGVDGVLEISRSCAFSTGCFPGDTPGLPVTITVPGSYRLTENFDLTLLSPHTTAISIGADHVTLDLNGFEIAGPCAGGPPCAPTGTGFGVTVAPVSVGNVALRNGTIRGMGDDGVLVGRDSIVEGVRAIGNGGYGIRTWTGTSFLSGNLAEGNNEWGIRVSTGSVVTDNVVTGNVGGGIEVVGHGVVVLGNSAASNATNGLNSSLGVIHGVLYVNNAVRENANNGIRPAGGNLVVGNVSSGNMARGIATSGNGSLILENGVYGNQTDGISTSSTNAVGGNTVAASGGSELNGTPLAVECNAIGASLLCPPP